MGELWDVSSLCGWLMASGSLQAHHSLAGVYDMKKEAEVSGTLTKIQFVNPHGSMTHRGQEPGRHDHRVGVYDRLRHHPRGTRDRQEPNVLKAGDTITAKFIPARNGSPLGFLKSMTTADGTRNLDLRR